MKKLDKTMIGVGVFIILLILALQSEMSNADPVVSLGSTAFNSHEPYGEFGYEYNKWEANIGIIGSGPTQKGDQGEVHVYSISRIVKPDWSFLKGKNYYRIGLAYVDDTPLVGDTNYRLGIGIDYGVFSIEYIHYSSSGIHETNRGIDAFQLRIDL